MVQGCGSEIGKIQGQETFFCFELGGVDLILSVTLLGKLGEVKVNWRTLTMNFSDQGSLVKIMDNPTLATSLVIPQALKKETKTKVVSIIWGMKNVEPESGDESTNHLTEKQQRELGKILKACKGVFCEPKVLPPHRITLPCV